MSTRRFDGAGIRRWLRQSIDGGSGAAPPADPFASLWSQWGASALWWWQGGASYIVGGSWIDRTASIEAAPQGAVTLSTVTMGSADATRIAYTDATWLSATVPGTEPYRIFALVAASSPDPVLLEWYGGGGDVLITHAEARAAGGGFTSSRNFDAPPWTDGSPHVVRAEYNATHASHALYLDGVAQTGATFTDDANVTVPAATTLEFLYFNATETASVGLICAIPYAAMTNLQAAAFASSAATIGGV